ncbi:hypothetical protein [uncultured Paludibaculum sp.]|uniref:hypothetical protein n=1 Tax=uncultured Paludibaculum sp. TaxID=1765020 RepID=UPI002AABA137|nr:hypothetical protein [uncultured Paludibaculum sp.]
MTILRVCIAATALAIWMVPSPAQQDAATQEQRKERALERLQQMKDRLKLTPEQEEQVRPIVMDELQQLKSIRDNHSGDQNRRGKMKMAREMRGVQSETEGKLSKVLSKPQMDELKKMREEMRQQMRDRAGKQ